MTGAGHGRGGGRGNGPRQKTLQQWTRIDGSGSDTSTGSNVTSNGVPHQARGQSSSTGNESTTSSRVRMAGKGNRGKRGRGAAARGGGPSSKRGRGGGRGGGKFTYKVADETHFDDDDDICELALNAFEFQNNDVAQAFANINEENELPGFDQSAGDIWIYPTNKSVRDYQFSIVQTALFNNTLVSLPTGLGKTFIAAVVMFNFHRWYPNNVIVFMAPTRPLVTQQLDACHNIMGIAPSKMIEVTGQIPPKKREELWKEKKVFFLTPQVMMSDLERGYCPAEQVRLVVVDEAHRAQGSYAYVSVVTHLAGKHKYFRVLALSATPGNDVAAVQDVIKNLLISHVELRSETSPDIMPYTRQKEVETVVVRLDDNCKQVHDKVMEIYQNCTAKLIQQNALSGRVGGFLSQYQLLKSREAFRTSSTASNVPNHVKGQIELGFATAMTLAHSLELISVHGLRSFYSFLNGVLSKEKGHGQVTAELKRRTIVDEILSDLKTKLKITTDNSSLDTSGFLSINRGDDSTALPEDNPIDYCISHPKFKVLKEIVVKHFEDFNTSHRSTRVMIFSQYRDSVQEIGNMLNSLRPLIKPMVFVGQSSSISKGRGLKQREQEQVVQTFRDGGFNVLVSTSVGEEGLDIGEVDLIICFDCNKSPTRLIQRMGRTGRKREGRSVFLLTWGKEESMYKQSIYQSKTINKNILDTKRIEAFLYKQSPRMVPPGINPKCFKMDIILSSEQESQQQLKNRTKKRNSKCSEGTSSSSNTNSNNNNLIELTLTQCFARNAIPKKDKAVKPVPAISVSEDQRKDNENIYDDNEFSVLNAFHGDNSFKPVWNDNEYETLCNLLSIQTISSETVADCVRIPKLTSEFEWLPEYNNFDPDRIVLRGAELDAIREKVEASYAFLNSSTHCECGLAYATITKANEIEMMGEFEMDDDDFDFNLITDFGDFSDSNQIPEDNSISGAGKIHDEVGKQNYSKNSTNSNLNQSSSQKIKPICEQSNVADNHPDGIGNGNDDEFPEFDFDTAFLFEEDIISSPNPVNTNCKNASATFVAVNQDDKLPPQKMPQVTTEKDIEKENDVILLDDDDDDDSSTTSNEEFIPVRVRQLQLANSTNNVEQKDKEVMDSSTTSNEEFIPVRARQVDSVMYNVNKVNLPAKRFAFKKLDTATCTTKKTLSPKSDTECLSPVLVRNSNMVQDNVFTRSGQVSPLKSSQQLATLDSSPEKSPVLRRFRDFQSSSQAPLAFPNFGRSLTTSAVENQEQEQVKNMASQNSSSSSEDFIPASPERKSRPVISPSFQHKKDATQKWHKMSQSKASGFTVAAPSPVLCVKSTNEQKQKPSTSVKSDDPIKNMVTKPSDTSVSVPVTDSKKSTSGFKSWNESILATISQLNKRNQLNNSSNPILSVKATDADAAVPSTSTLMEPKKKFMFKKASARKIEFTEEKKIPVILLPESPTSSSDTTYAPVPVQQSQAQDPPVSTRKPETYNSDSSSDLEDFLDSTFMKPVPVMSGRHHLKALSKFKQNKSSTPSKNTWISLNKENKDDKNGKPKKTSNVKFNSTEKDEKQPKRKRKKKSRNPFLDDEASVSGDESSDDDLPNSDSELDTSFVDQESDHHVTESQQVRYIKSMKSPGLILRTPLRGVHTDLNGTQYEPDSFCVPNDDVEFAEVGVYTQAMIKAREDLEKEAEEEQNRLLRAHLGIESQEAGPSRRLRSHPSANNESQESITTKKKNLKKKRKRIVEFSSSSEDE